MDIKTKFSKFSRQKVLMIMVLCFAFVFTATAAFAALTFNSTTISSDGNIILTPTGNVGIGTTTVSAKFHSQATTEQLRLGYDASNYNSFTVGSTGSLNIAATGTNPNITLTPGGIGYTLLNGNVGIGTTAPRTGSKLEVAGVIQTDVQTTDPGCTTTADIGKIWFDNTTTTTAEKHCMNVAGVLTWKTVTFAP